MAAWHDARIVYDPECIEGEADDLFFEVDHEHPEDPMECELTQYLAHASDEEWDRLFTGGEGYFRIRVLDGELEVEPVEVNVVELP